MVDQLKNIIRFLVDFIQTGTHHDWESLVIAYDEPHVNRLWIQVGPYRVMIHEILPIYKTDKKPLFHLHRWNCAILLLKGKYETGVLNSKEPDLTSSQCYDKVNNKFILSEGSMYEMKNSSNEYEYHYVKPLTRCISIMITKKIVNDIPREQVKKLELSTMNWSDKVEFLKEILPLLKKYV